MQEPAADIVLPRGQLVATFQRMKTAKEVLLS